MNSSQEFLLKFEPTVGFGIFANWPGFQTKNFSGIFSITTIHDLCLIAYSRLAKPSVLFMIEQRISQILVDATEWERKTDRNAWIHYRYTLPFGILLVESHLDRLSSWNQPVISCFLDKVRPKKYRKTWSLRALRASTSSWRPYGPLDFVLRALQVCLFVCFFVCLFVFLFVCLFVCLFGF